MNWLIIFIGLLERLDKIIYEDRLRTEMAIVTADHFKNPTAKIKGSYIVRFITWWGSEYFNLISERKKEEKNDYIAHNQTQVKGQWLSYPHHGASGCACQGMASLPSHLHHPLMSSSIFSSPTQLVLPILLNL